MIQVQESLTSIPKKQDGAWIALILVLLIIVLLFVYLYCKRKRDAKKQEEIEEKMSQSQKSPSNNGSSRYNSPGPQLTPINNNSKSRNQIISNGRPSGKVKVTDSALVG